MATRFAERLNLLTDVAEGLSARVSFLVRTLSNPGGKLHCLTNQEWAKIRNQLDKKFPEMADLTKVQGYDSFRQAASQVVDECAHIHDMFLDIIEFREVAVPLLQEFPVELLETKLTINRDLIIMYFELFSAYIKLQLLIANVEERRTIISLYAAAFTYVNGASDENVSRVVALLITESHSRQIIEEFHNSSGRIGDMLLEFRQSITSAMLVDALRSRSVLNPCEEADMLAMPANKPLSPTIKVNIYGELFMADQYRQWVLFGGLFCPSNLFRDDFFGLFKLVAEDSLVLNLTRDNSINIHLYLEDLATWYPPRNLNITIPKQFKLKNVVKDLAKDATMNCGQRHRDRRAYLRGEMANLRQLFTICPGLIGPKFPVIMDALGMARAEILWHFRHIGARTTKARIKYLNPDNFTDRSISFLVELQYDLIRIVRSNVRIIQQYYMEYLKGAHRNKIAPLLGPVSELVSGSMTVKQIVQDLCSHLDYLDINSPETANLTAFRLNWQRALSSLCSKTNMQIVRNEHMVKLCLRMTEAHTHSYYVDSIEKLLSRFAELHELLWNQQKFRFAFSDSLSLGSSSCIGFIHVVASGHYNVHPDCPEEQSPNAEESMRVVDDMLKDVAESVEKLMTVLYDQFIEYDGQISAVEAGNRLERMQQAKRTKNAAGQAQPAQDPMPGHESHAWARAALSRLIGTHRAVAEIVSSMNRAKTFQVFHREFCPAEFIKNRMISFAKSRIPTIICDGNTMDRPSNTLFRLTKGLRAIQSVLNFVDCDSSFVIRQLMYEIIFDQTVPYMGSFTNESKVEEGATMTSPVLATLANWFTNFIETTASDSSDCVWIESKKSFMSASVIKGGASAKGVESYVDIRELRCLCQIIGPIGVKFIDREIFKLITNRVAKIRDYIVRNEGKLTEFQRKFLIENDMDGTGMHDCNGFVNDNILLGVALIVHELLHEALNDVQLQHSEFIHRTTETAQECVEGSMSYALTQRCAVLGADSGNVGDIDHSLAAVLKSLQPAASSTQTGNSPNPTGGVNRMIELLPFGYATCFAADVWRRANYIYQLDSFSNNEHLIMLAASRLLTCMNAREGNATASLNANKIFIEAASVLLLRMKSSEESRATGFPVKSMMLLLEKFISMSPLVDRSLLEKHCPYAILHSFYVDVSISRARGSDGQTNAFTTTDTTEDLKDA